MAPCSSPISPSTSYSQDCIATLGSKLRKLVYYGGGGFLLALLILGFATCSGAGPTEACPAPDPGSKAAQALDDAEAAADFEVLYPCYLPNSEQLENQAVVGEAGRQRVELIFDGPFDMTIRQSQYPPPVTPDPTGASRVPINLFSNVPATLIERNDGTREALYHLYWERDDIFYELQAYGPPLQRRLILQIARSLE